MPPLARTFRPRQQVTWQRKSVSGQDSFGQDVYTWTDVVSIMAQVTAETVAGREPKDQQQTWAEARYRVLHRHFPGLEREMRIYYWDGTVNRYLDVIDVMDPDGACHWTVAVCKEWAR